MPDDVRDLHARVAELTSRVNQLNAEKLYAERQTKTWKRLYVDRQRNNTRPASVSSASGGFFICGMLYKVGIY